MTGRAGAWNARIFGLGRSRRLRVAGIVIVTAFAVFNLAGFFGVPWLVAYVARGSVAASLHRRVTVGTIRFNPYTLRLSADTLHVSQREGSEDFAAVGQLRLKASWTSLFGWRRLSRKSRSMLPPCTSCATDRRCSISPT